MQNILLAAGLASRSGGEKLFYPYQGHTIIHHSVAASLAAGLFTVVVTGHRAEEVASELLDLSSPSLLIVLHPGGRRRLGRGAPLLHLPGRHAPHRGGPLPRLM